MTGIQLTDLQFVLLGSALALLMIQLFVKNKQAMHILFAIFCGSVAMSTAQDIAGDSIGPWQYIIGLGACATCNIYWLLARSMFREKQPFTIHHIGFAVLLGVLMMAKQGYLFVDSFWQFTPAFQNLFTGLLSEVTFMLSSVVLILAVWEGIRGFNAASKEQKIRRLVFLLSICMAIGVTKTVAVSHSDQPELIRMVIVGVTLYMLLLTQGIVFWRTKGERVAHKVPEQQLSEVAEAGIQSATKEAYDYEAERELAGQVQDVIKTRYLHTNLKVADVARALDVSEYRVGRVLKYHFQARNFNHYVNQLRIAHACSLLSDCANKDWPVLVIGMESGFASVGPFTRAFKQFTGLTPNQYRLKHSTTQQVESIHAV